LAITASVVIPAYNASGTIVRAVKSALEQSVAPCDVVVGCDGCSDDTGSLARGAGAKVLELPRANGSIARNAAAREARGEVLFFLDSDDFWKPGKIKAHLEVWSSQSPSFVIDRSTPVLPDGTQAHWTGGLDREGDADWTEFLSYRAWASGSSFSVSRKNFDAIGGFSERLNKFQDVDFWVRCAHECGQAHTLPASYTYYSVSERPSVSKVSTQVDENLSRLFEGWTFASEEQLSAFASHAYLTAAEVTPWPKSVSLFKKAHWPVSKRFFWKSLYQSLRRSA
jgi:glycosyltransferase involved in cell wall biosynthesis